MLIDDLTAFHSLDLTSVYMIHSAGHGDNPSQPWISAQVSYSDLSSYERMTPDLCSKDTLNSQQP